MSETIKMMRKLFTVTCGILCASLAFSAPAKGGKKKGAGGAFTEELIKNFIKTKREECRAMAAIPHPAEYDKYFNL